MYSTLTHHIQNYPNDQKCINNNNLNNDFNSIGNDINDDSTTISMVLDEITSVESNNETYNLNLPNDEKKLEDNNNLGEDKQIQKKNYELNNYYKIKEYPLFSIQGLLNQINKLPNLIKDNEKIVKLKEKPSDIIENNLKIIIDCFIESGGIIIDNKKHGSDEISESLDNFFEYILNGNYYLKKKLTFNNIFKTKIDDDKNSINMSVSKYNELMNHIKKKWISKKKLHVNLVTYTDNIEKNTEEIDDKSINRSNNIKKKITNKKNSKIKNEKKSVSIKKFKNLSNLKKKK